MVVVGGRQVHKDSTGDPSSLKTILKVLNEVDELAGCRFAWTESCLFWDDLLVYGWGNLVQYQPLKQLVCVP